MIVKKLLVHQALFIQAPFRFLNTRFFFLIAGYGAGKTSSLNDALIKGVMELSGKKDREGKLPKIMLCGITLTFLKKTFSGAFVQILKNTRSKFEYDKAHNIITVAGVEIYLTPIIEPDEIFGYDVAAIFVDELDELPTYKAIAVVKSLNDRARQVIDGAREPYLMFATTSQGLKGTYQVVENFKKIGMNHVIIRGRTRDNTFLPKEYVETMYKIYNEKERRCLLEGEFISIEAGKVYPDFNPAVNESRINFAHKVRPTDTVYIGQDFNRGFNKAVAGIVVGNKIVVIKNYSFPDIRRAPEVFRYDFPESPIIWIPDATSMQSMGSFKKECRAHNIKVAYRTKNPLVRDRTFLINKLFYALRLVIGGGNAELTQALIIRQNDPKTGAPMKGQGESAPDHVCDGLEYMVYYIVSWRREMKDIYGITIKRRADKRIDAGVTNLEDETYTTDENSVIAEVNVAELAEDADVT